LFTFLFGVFKAIVKTAIVIFKWSVAHPIASSAIALGLNLTDLAWEPKTIFGGGLKWLLRPLSFIMFAGSIAGVAKTWLGGVRAAMMGVPTEWTPWMMVGH